MDLVTRVAPTSTPTFHSLTSGTITSSPLFEKISFHDNRVEEATAEKQAGRLIDVGVLAHGKSGEESDERTRV